ncbi:MAG: substrate-binding domain-containing protein [Clostridiales bacterium]|nr:substrate-binding domain-containing protein [Clostridiales bacterium]
MYKNCGKAIHTHRNAFHVPCQINTGCETITAAGAHSDKHWKAILKAAFILILSALILFLTGCSEQEVVTETEETEAEARLQIGLSFDSFVIERWLRDRDMFVSTAQSLGADVNVQVASGDSGEQISQVEYFIQKGMDVIVIIAVDGDALKDVVNKAIDSGIRVICYDRLISDVNADLYISFDNFEVGVLMAEALISACPDGGEIFAIYGSPTDLNVDDVVDGFTATLKGSGLEIVYSAYCDNWLAELAFDYVNEGLEVSRDIVAVMCGNDDLASQAIKALSENQLAGQVTVVGQDAELSACQRIVEGTQEMTVYKSVEDEAMVAATLAVALARGEDITSDDCTYPVTETVVSGSYEVPYYKLDPVAVTAENIDEVIIAGGYHSKDDVYLNIREETESEL